MKESNKEKEESCSGGNNVWHIDKLKLFGFLVHGCIHRFSRKLVWLEVTSSKKVPEIITQYSLKAVRRLKGILKNESR